jgi:chemotaxis protein CheD
VIPVTVGVGDCRVCNEPGSVLIAYALGSCLAIMIHDRQANVGGLLHFMLPESQLDPEKAGKQPYMFADTGIPLLFRKAYEMGADKRRMVVVVAGGSQMMGRDDAFNIGKRNYIAMRKIFSQAGVLVQAEEVGGVVSRTVRLEVGSGKVFLRQNGEKEQELAVTRLSGERKSNGVQRTDC